jgi:hypothetical protein
MPELDPYWLQRLQSVGKAQARYLWFLLVAALFYLALRPQVIAGSTGALQIPIVELQLDGSLVLASGPVVLSFLVLAIMGSLRAFRRARDKLSLGHGADWQSEAADTHPNAIDLAFYTTPESPKVLATVAYFAYPGVLLAGLLEAAWFWYELTSEQYAVDHRTAFLVISVFVWVPAAWQVGTMLVGRLKKIPQLWQIGGDA